ncbi:MAG: hypothetical protein JW776_08125 [Candidatus Lokiarchaeota archaeon]|nr:hypothetical protein [Candidatus Lokiarchaeota archaeon]
MSSKERFSHVRYFSKKKYLTDYREYDSKTKAKAVVLFFKAKHAGILPIRARVIDRGEFFQIYFDENTYNQMQEGIIKLPEYSNVPDTVIRKVQLGEIKNQKRTNGPQIHEIKSNYMYGRKESYHVVKLEKDKPKYDLIQETRKVQKISAKDTLEDSLRFMLLIEILHNMYLIPDDVYDLKYWANKEAFDHVYEIWEQERDLNESLDIIHETFIDSCPKCGSEMKPNFIELGSKGRLSVFQCSLCKFYLPRAIE